MNYISDACITSDLTKKILLTYEFPWKVHSVFPAPVDVRIKLNHSYQEVYGTRPQLFMNRSPFWHLHVV